VAVFKLCENIARTKYNLYTTHSILSAKGREVNVRPCVSLWLITSERKIVESSNVVIMLDVACVTDNAILNLVIKVRIAAHVQHNFLVSVRNRYGSNLLKIFSSSYLDL